MVKPNVIIKALWLDLGIKSLNIRMIAMYMSNRFHMHATRNYTNALVRLHFRYLSLDILPQLISTANATDMIGTNSKRQLPIRILARLSKMLESTDQHTKLEQGMFKQYLNKKVHLTPKFEDGQLVFVKTPKMILKLQKMEKKTSQSQDFCRSPAELSVY